MRYSITYGRQARAAAYEMVKVELWREFDENIPLEAAWASVEEWVEKRIQEKLDAILAKQFKQAGPTPTPPPTPPPISREEIGRIPRIDLEGLPFTSYATKKPARAGEAGWIRTNNPDAGDLANAISDSPNQRLELEPYVFTFSGDNDQFISRRPLKKGRGSQA